MPEFYDNWCYPTIEGDTIVWRLNLSPEQISQLEPIDIWDYSIQTVRLLKHNLGDKPAVCLSGGVDSQVMVDCFIRSGIAFDVVIMRFEEDLNDHDIKTAVEFCHSRNIPYTYVDLDVIRFLSRDLIPFANKYNVSSPQFATHFHFFEKLQEMGYTSAVCGGNTLLNSNLGWSCPTTKEQNDWREFSEKSGFYVMGDFLSYYWKFSLLFSCHIEASTLFESDKISLLSSMPNYDDLVAERYKAKTAGFRAAGFNIIPQENKLTGFEEVKLRFGDQVGDGWAFEKLFRFPLNLINPPTRTSKLELTEQQKHALDFLYDKCSFTRTTTRIAD